MNFREMKIKQKPSQDNFFECIPEDLLLFMLSKINDLKYLCQCCLVSKRFNLTIHLIKNVSVYLPSNETYSAEVARDIAATFSNISRLTIEEINRFITSSSSLKWLKFLLFIHKFRQLESISLKFTCPADLCSSSLFNFMVRCSDSGTLCQRIISIVPGRVYKVIAHENIVNHVAPVDKLTFCYTKVSLGCSAKWLFVMYLLLKYQPSLMSVVITDLNKPWTLVLKDKQLIAMRNYMFSKGRILGNMAPTEEKSGVLSELFLPISGYVMSDVNFEIEDVKLPSHSGSSRDCVTCKNESPELVSDDVMIWEFVGDKKIINEAVHEILGKLDG